MEKIEINKGQWNRCMKGMIETDMIMDIPIFDREYLLDNPSDVMDNLELLFDLMESIKDSIDQYIKIYNCYDKSFFIIHKDELKKIDELR